MKTIIILKLALGVPDMPPTGVIELTGFASLAQCETVAASYRTDLDEMAAHCVTLKSVK